MGGIANRHHTNARRNAGRSHMALQATKFAECPKCHVLMQSHRACQSCGYYKGVELIDVMKKANKKEQKRREKVLGQTDKKK